MYYRVRTQIIRDNSWAKASNSDTKIVFGTAPKIFFNILLKMTLCQVEKYVDHLKDFRSYGNQAFK